MNVHPYHNSFASLILLPRGCLRPKYLRYFSTGVASESQLVYSNLRLRSLCHSNRIDDARLLFEQMPTRDEYSWNTMITAYVKSGYLPEATRLLTSCPHRDSTTISWSFLISRQARHGRGDEALQLFRCMLLEGPKPDRYTLGSALRACAARNHPEAGRQIHALALKSLLGNNGFVLAGLVDMYAKCGQVTEALRLFAAVPPDELQNHVLWAAMITGHAQNNDASSALRLFKSMLSEGVAPNQFVLPSVLCACSAEFAAGLGAQVHGFVVRLGFDNNDFVQCALVDVYSKCGDPSSATKVLDQMHTLDVVAWNSLLVGCVHNGLELKAMSIFMNMHRRGLGMDEFTYPTALSCVASAGLHGSGRSIHCMVMKAGYDRRHRHVSNALVDMYAKLGKLDDACGVFDGAENRDVVAWTSLITGCARHVSCEKALQLFREMWNQGIDLDEFLVAAVLRSCAGLAVLDLGRQIHGFSVHRGFDSFVTVANSAITMYAKCGCVDESCRVFESSTTKDTITWTAMIVCHAQNGRGEESVRLYDTMTMSGVKPDYVTFIGLLFACSHAGLVDEGRTHFESMQRNHGVAPGPEHYASMIDLLGRAGRLQEAEKMVEGMATPPDATVWKALLAACRVHRDIGLAEKAAGILLELDPSDAVPYVLLSNIYSTARRWGDAARVRKLMRSRGISKEPGCSWMEVGKKVHVFRSEDAVHPRAAEVYAMVEEMMGRIEEVGYVADGDWGVDEEDEEGKRRSLKYHSEKLAVAFGLICAPKEAPIRILKNLRVCGDCHGALKLVSKVFDRYIVLRDSNRFHHFSGGICSCGDYW